MYIKYLSRTTVNQQTFSTIVSIHHTTVDPPYLYPIPIQIHTNPSPKTPRAFSRDATASAPQTIDADRARSVRPETGNGIDGARRDCNRRGGQLDIGGSQRAGLIAQGENAMMDLLEIVKNRAQVNAGNLKRYSTHLQHRPGAAEVGT